MVHVGLIQLSFQFIWSSHRLDFTIHHDRDAVTILSLIHVVSCYKDSNAAVGCLIDEFPKLASGGWINTACRLIKKNDFWFMEDADGESQLLLSAKRNACYDVIAMFCEMEFVEQFFGLLPDVLVVHSIDTCKETNVFPDS